MKSIFVLLVAAIIQGAFGQNDQFSVEPTSSNIVPAGGRVVLECITRESATCSWKFDVPGLEPTTGFLANRVPSGIGISVRDANSDTDCSIIIDSVEMRHSGKYTCSPYLSSGQIDATPAEVIVAVEPSAIEFTGELLGATELLVSAAEPVSVTCQARDARPKAELRWFLGDRQLTEGVTDDEETNPDSKLITSRSTLTHQFAREDEGAELRCVAKHPAYGEQGERQAALSVMVQFAPVRAEGSDLGTLYGFTENEPRSVTVNFTANPEPYTITWTVGQDMPLGAGQQTNDGRISAGPLEQVDAEAHQYAARLSFDPVLREDMNTTFTLLLINDVGQEKLSLRVGADAPPPPPVKAPKAAPEAGMSGGAIGGIIVAVILLLAVIALVAFARSRGKWCFAAKPSDAGAEASDTESAHDEKTDKPEGKGFKLSDLYSSLVTKKKEGGDVEAAGNKEETKELTAPDGEGSPKREKEVVYAELVLDKDGVKTEVRPSSEKTEYAVIVGTKTPEEPKKE